MFVHFLKFYKYLCFNQLFIFALLNIDMIDL